MLRPRLFDTLKSYTRKQLLADLMAGSIVGIVALPLAIAFAIASGVTPERGLYTAIIAGFLISVLGGSRRYDQWEASIKYGAGRTGDSEPLFAALWEHTCHRRTREHSRNRHDVIDALRQ